jgi:hypothetical protein
LEWLAIALGCLGSLTQATGGEAIPIPTQASIRNSVPNLEQQSSSETISPITCETSSEVGINNVSQTCPEPEANGMEQVRSVAELSDVHPSDWAFQALQALVERYGIVVGYPDGTFRGERSLSRYEFAALLQRVMDYVYNQRNPGTRQEFEILQRLQKSYADILQSQDPQRLGLEPRVDALDIQVTKLEKQVFSTTTKLSGQAVIVPTSGSNAPLTFVSRVRLGLITSFTGKDTLLTQLEAGNNGTDAVSRVQNRFLNLLGTNGLLAGGGGLDYVGVGSGLRLSRLSYTFQPLADLSVTVGTRIHPRDFIDQNRFANSSDKNFVSSFFMGNPLIVQNQIERPGGSGVVLHWKPTDNLNLKALYLAADADRPNPGFTPGGLFGDRYQGSVELGYELNRDFVTRLQFTRAVIDGLSVYAGGVNVEWAWNQQFALFGRYGIGTYQGFTPFLGRNLDTTVQTWAIGSIIRNIVIPGSTAGFAIGQPFATSSIGNRTQTNFEGFYSFLLNDNISVTPGFMIVSNPNNRSSGNVWEFFLRMVLSF